MAFSQTGTIGWFARHEFNLSWRDFMRMMSGGKPGREKTVIGVLILTAIVMHIIAFAVLKPAIETGIDPDKSLFSLLTGGLLLTISLMMSQAMELVTRAFYSRSDLDLILSSPVSVKRLFAVRIGAIASTTTALSMLLCGSAINVLAIFDSANWLYAYPIILACGFLATSISLALTILMFRTLGAKRTRLASQIVAAVVGASFIIGIQLAAIASIGSISRLEFLQSDMIINLTPDAESWFWVPARAVLGEMNAFIAVFCAAVLLFVGAIYVFAGSFAQHVVSAAGVNFTTTNHKASRRTFKRTTMRTALRHKEWTLLLRDHWLLSQTLMQILYLVPPAFMLWQGFGNAGVIGVVVVPVLVMASGQLSGGLAWLAISGEDAPDLVETAPVVRGAVIRAKIEAVLGAIAIVVSPIILLMAIADIQMAVIALAGIAAASVSATCIQLWFRSQAKRSNFRRRQTSSKIATLAEAFSSILWAGTAALLAAGSWLLLVPMILALMVLWTARSFRPETPLN